MLSHEILNCVFSSVSAARRLGPQIAVLPWQDSGCVRRFHVLAICNRSMQQADPHILSYWLTVLLALIHRSSAAFSSAAWILLLPILLSIISCSFLFYPASSSSAGTSTLPTLLLMTLLPCSLLSSQYPAPAAPSSPNNSLVHRLCLPICTYTTLRFLLPILLLFYLAS